MENVSYIGLSHQSALKHMMDVTANNIANMTTPAYKGQNVLFKEYVENPQGGDKMSMVLDLDSYRKLEQGPMERTGNDLDLAIEGNGYFAVETLEGVRYTRAGAFMMNDQQQLVTKDGFAVLSADNQPLAIQEEASKIYITKEGLITTDVGEVGQLNLVEFDSEQGLELIGQNLYDAGEQAALPAQDSRILQGMLEGSNVQPVVEMNRMIEVLRAYQSVQKIMQNDHERIRGTIQKLTKV
jgi:flagellar basal-body rod protein FlgF